MEDEWNCSCMIYFCNLVRELLVDDHIYHLLQDRTSRQTSSRCLRSEEQRLLRNDLLGSSASDPPACLFAKQNKY